jgi:hypothetical protein
VFFGRFAWIIDQTRCAFACSSARFSMSWCSALSGVVVAAAAAAATADVVFFFVGVHVDVDAGASPSPAAGSPAGPGGLAAARVQRFRRRSS